MWARCLQKKGEASIALRSSLSDHKLYLKSDDSPISAFVSFTFPLGLQGLPEKSGLPLLTFTGGRSMMAAVGCPTVPLGGFLFIARAKKDMHQWMADNSWMHANDREGLTCSFSIVDPCFHCLSKLVCFLFTGKIETNREPLYSEVTA